VAHVSADPGPLFVYGSLLFPDVLHVLIDRDPAREPVSVAGWRVTALHDQVYPTLVADSASTATGHLLTDLSPEEWRVLDAFENPIYQLARIEHSAGHAWAYAAVDQLDPTSWHPEDFDRAHLAAYLGRCSAWRQRYEERLSQA
jgi:gamma-glutamylcyclotransferase (GGCT)/AIG2-like uncharacterized protein YtfP